MSTLPRQSVNAAYRAETYASGAIALPNRRPVLPAPAPPARSQPVPAPRPRPRHAIQLFWLFALVLLAMLVVSAGMMYLSGHAQVTQEGYRRTKLMGMLKQAREKQQQTKQMRALVYTPAHIEQKARALGMVPAEEKQMVTVGETTPAQLLQSSLIQASLSQTEGIRH